MLTGAFSEVHVLRAVLACYGKERLKTNLAVQVGGFALSSLEEYKVTEISPIDF
jgi:hypothetical protein